MKFDAKKYLEDMIIKNQSFGVRGFRIENFYDNKNDKSERHTLLLYHHNHKFELNLNSMNFIKVKEYLGVTHISKQKRQIEASLFTKESFEHKLFTYNADGSYTLHMETLRDSARGHKDVPVLLFYGDSNALKSYMGSLYGNQGKDFSVLETDSYNDLNILYNTPIYDNVVVIGNRKKVDHDKLINAIVSDNIITVKFEHLKK